MDNSDVVQGLSVEISANAEPAVAGLEAVDAAAKKAVENLVSSNEQLATAAARTGEQLQATARVAGEAVQQVAAATATATHAATQASASAIEGERRAAEEALQYARNAAAGARTTRSTGRSRRRFAAARPAAHPTRFMCLGWVPVPQ